MKKRKMRVYLSLYIFIIFLILISNISAKADYNMSNSNTWAENLDKFREDLTDESKVKNINEILQKLSPSQRIYISEKIKASSGAKSSEAKLIGFGSQNLRFYKLDKEKDKGKLWIGDGYSWIDFSNLPDGIGSVKYVEGGSGDNNRGKFIFFQKNGGEISIETGWVEGNKLFYGKTWSHEMEAGEFSLKGAGDKIFLDRNKRINLEGKAEIKINGKTFSVNDLVLNKGQGYDYKKAYVIKTGDAEYKASNIKITSENTIIRTFKDTETNVFLKSGDFSKSSQYVQVYDNKINMVGKGIEVEAIKEYKDAKGNLMRYNIDLNGEELYFRDGGYLAKVNKDKTWILRNPFEKDENGNPKKTYPVELINLQDTTERIIDEGDFKGVKITTPKSQTWVMMTELEKKEPGGRDTVKITTGFDSSYRDLPDNLPSNLENFKDALTSIPKKIEIETRLNLGIIERGWSGHTQYINGKDLYDSFFYVNQGGKDKIPDGTIESFKKQGFILTNSELQAFQGVFSSALEYDPNTPKNIGKEFPKGSRIFINIGEDAQTASVETWINNKGEVERSSTPITGANALSAIKKYSRYSILAEDPEMPGYDPSNGIKTPLDKLIKEYPNRKTCPDCFKY